MKTLSWGGLILIPMILMAGGNPGNPLREFTVEDTVKWVLTGIEHAYNEGSVDEVMRYFSPDYTDANGITFNTLNAFFTTLLAYTKDDEDRFLTYNLSAQVENDQALLAASIIIRPSGVGVEETGILVTNETLTLKRYGDNWVISSAPNLTSILNEAVVIDSVFRAVENRNSLEE